LRVCKLDRCQRPAALLRKRTQGEGASIPQVPPSGSHGSQLLKRRYRERAPAEFGTEKIEPQTRFSLRNRDSQVPLGRTNSTNMRAIFELRAENAKIKDCVAEGVEFEPSGDFVNGQ
jgi:hypothetical protein